MDSKKKRGMSRREFMKASTAAAAAAAVGGGWLGMRPTRSWADKKANSVIIGMTLEMDQFNPILWGSNDFEGPPSSAMFDALWDPRPDGTWSPNLAVRVPTVENGGVSKDGLTWKIDLRKDVKWQDRVPFTAADVEFTWQKVVDPKVNARNRTGFDQIKEFKAVDDHHFEYTMASPFAPMYVAWGVQRIVPKHVLSKVPDMNTCAWNTTGTFGTGPFKMVERVPGSHIMFKRNPNYHLGAPKLETVILKFVPDQDVIYIQMKTGEIDFLYMVGIPAPRYEEAKTLPGLDILPTETVMTENVLLNCDRPFFQDKRVRQALYMAIDKQTIIKDIYYGLVKPGLSYLNPSHWAYNHNLKDPYNPRKAAELLDSIGWKVGPDGVRAKDGVKLAFQLSTSTGNKQREQEQLMIQKNWKDIGISAEIKNYSSAVMWGAFFEETQYDAIVLISNPDLETDPDFSSSMHSKRPRWHYHPGTPEMDTLLEEGLRTLAMEKRKEIYGRFQELFLDEAVYLPLFVNTLLYAKKKELKGYVTNPCSSDGLRFIREWYW